MRMTKMKEKMIKMKTMIMLEMREKHERIELEVLL